jgi:hypothetical protein
MILAPDDRLPDGPARWSREALSEAWASCRRDLRAALQDPEVATVAVLVGIPASGKSSWCRDHDQPGLVIFDACWADRKRRIGIAHQIRAAGKVAIAVWMQTPLDVARDRNALRPVETRVPDVAMARAWVALKHEPPCLAEGWSRVLVQDGQAERIHDAKVTHEQKLERAAKAPVSTAWKIIGSKILPALAAAEPGQGIPPEVEEHLAALQKLLAKGSAKTAADIAKIGAQIDKRGRAEWDKIVTKAIGSPWETGANEALVSGWASAKAAKVNAIAADIVPGLRASIAEGLAKSMTAAEIGKAWSEEGLPLTGFGTAEGRTSVLARSAAAELSSASTKAAQEAVDADQYEWGPTTSKNPDPAHAAFRGKRFRWSDPPPDGHPGERPGCHCTAKPVLTSAEAKDIKAALALEAEAAAPKTAPKPTPAAPPVAAKAKPAPKPKAPAKPKTKPEPGGWKPLPVPAPIAVAPKAEPVKPAPAPPKPVAPPAPKQAPAAKAVPDPVSWTVASKLEAKAMAELTPAKRKKLQKLIEQDQPVHDPTGPKVGTEGSSAAAKAWGKSLTKKQRAAVVDWSESGYSRMRAVDGGIGRGSDLEMSGERYLKTREHLVELRAAMRAAPKHEGEIFRGLTIPLNVPSAKAYHDMMTTKGAVFKLESLSSWSHNKAVSKNQFSADVPGGLLVRISKSSRGVPINAEGLSSFGDEEGEILIDKGSQYRVVSVSRDKDDQHRLIVDLEEI